MIHFVSISTFRRRLEILLKVKRGVYSAAPDAICEAFKGSTIEQIRQNRDMILMDNDAVAIKLRLQDKRQHLSKSEGYRLIYLVMKHVPLVAHLDIYPKRGPLQQLDIEKAEIERLVAEFKAEMLADILVEHDINDHLREIIPH